MRKMCLAVVLFLTLLCVSGVLMPEANANRSSEYFHGKYFYDNGSSSQFEGILYRQNTKIWGECTDQDGSKSTISGNTDGDSINFIKTYNNDNHRVQYSGRYYSDTNTIKGNWRTSQNNIGSFYMTMD